MKGKFSEGKANGYITIIYPNKDLLMGFCKNGYYENYATRFFYEN